MAIVDNKKYALSGAQIKDLASKIEEKAADITFVGATSSAQGSKGLVPAPASGDDTKFLAGDGTWKIASGGGITKHEIIIEGATGEFILCPNPFVDYQRTLQIFDQQGNNVYPVQLAEWALNGDEFLIVPYDGDYYYHRATPIKAIINVAMSDSYTPGTTPFPDKIEDLMVSYTVSDSHYSYTYPKVPSEFTVVLEMIDREASDFRATVFQGGTLPFFFIYDSYANFSWSYLSSANMVQGVLPSSVAWTSQIPQYFGPLSNSEHLCRILSALYVGKTISVTAMREIDSMLFPLAGITFDRFLIESLNGSPIPTEASVRELAEAINNYAVRLYLYGSASSQNLVVQIFGDSVQVSGQ